MEKSSKHLSVLALAAILMTACSQDFVAEDVSASMPNPPKAKSENTISYNVSMSEMKKYLQPSAKLSTRAGGKDQYDITPIISDGDTVMYLVNKLKGWELYSGDKRLPAKLAFNNVFSLNIDSLTDIQQLFISSIGDKVKRLRKNEGVVGSANSVSSEWMRMSSRETSEGQYVDQEMNEHWVLYSSYEENYSHSNPHLMSTSWNPFAIICQY